ncbi:MAG: DUF6364 family protein [Sulfuricellaceae bacterium]
MATLKLTLSVDEKDIDKARRYSKKHNVSISRMVGQYMASLPDENENYSPTVRRLMGILPVEAGEEEYQHHLEGKYRI